MKLRMDVLKSGIESKSVELVLFMRKELEELEFTVSTIMRYKLKIKRCYGLRFSISILDSVTNEIKDLGFGEYINVRDLKGSETFLHIENLLLSLLGSKMFDYWVECQIKRTKGRKKLTDLICKYNSELNSEGVLSMLNKHVSGEVNFTLLPTLLKPVKTAFCRCEIMSYETLSLE